MTIMSANLTRTHHVLAMMYGLNLTLKNEIVKIAPKGRVNCVAPGWVRTPMAEEALKDPQMVYRVLSTLVTPSSFMLHVEFRVTTGLRLRRWPCRSMSRRRS